MFFIEEIGELRLNDQLDIYHYILSNDSSHKKAFPVPYEYFQVHKNKEKEYLYLKEYFESYYKGEKFDKKEFGNFTHTKPFIGSKYVWYYKNTN